MEAKKPYYTPSETIELLNAGAKITSLQDLLNHTISSILMIDSVNVSSFKNLTFYFKCGCNGSSGQSEYKQLLVEETEQISVSQIFITSLVPIKLRDDTTGISVWQNPVPSSVRICRPISTEYCKETS